MYLLEDEISTLSVPPEKSVDSSTLVFQFTVVICCNYLCTLNFSTALKNPPGQKLYFLVCISIVSSIVADP